ncbi:hypothetical protein [Jiangella muralis]|uniref:hypothetical protein n=1 Tax=Jiangella muralis TaxID=702383 RepID=UPI0012FA69CF|nr:hypothetical protein [Jiangella muralis]
MGRVFYDGRVSSPRLDHPECVDGAVPDGLASGPDGRLYAGCNEPSKVLRFDISAKAVETVLDDPIAHLLCHPADIAFRGDDLFAANLGRWHVTVIEDLQSTGSTFEGEGTS